jgi:hypothetical protein
VAKTHCAVTHSSRARQRVPHISMRRTQPMLPSPSDIEVSPPAQIMLQRLASLLLPRSWFVALLKTAFPFLPKSLEQFRENDHD